MPELSLEKEFRDGLRESLSGNKQPSDDIVALYGLLFGENRARLHVVAEFRSVSGDPDGKKVARRFIHVSEERPLEGKDSWLESDARQLSISMKNGARMLGSDYAWLQESGGALSNAVQNGTGEPSPTRKCQVGDNEIVEGVVVAKRGDIELVRPSVSPVTLMYCAPAGR
jgi:hypothetical protein